MGRDVVSVLLASILWVHCGLSAKAEVLGAAATSQASSSQKPTLKEQVIQIPAGPQVEVRLLSKERLGGRLGEVSDEGFSVQIAQGNRIETRQVAFGDVKSVKLIEKGKRRNFLLGAGVALVVLFVLAVTVGHLGRED